MELNQKKNRVIDWIDDNKDCFLEVSHKIWQTPELGMEEVLAASLVVDLLMTHGFEVESGVAGMPTAFAAVWGKGKPVIGFTSEYDALPGLSQKKDSPVKDCIRPGGPGHGCGHNLMSIGGPLAAVALKEEMLAEGIECTIKVFGTPAEEIMIGKPFMAREGYFDDVDVFLDWHSMSENSANATFNNGYFNLRYYFAGKTCHGNAPWFGKSTLDAAMLTAHSIEMLREHLPPGDKKAATTINYALPDVGNSFPNVVPDRTTLWVIGRGENADLLREMMESLHKCAEGCALATQTAVTYEVITAVPNMLPNETISKVMDSNFRYVGTPKFTEEEQQDAREVQRQAGVMETGFTAEIAEYNISGMPATDSSQLTWMAPYAAVQVQVLPSENLGWHNWAVARFAGGTAGEKTVTAASKVLAATAIELIENQEIIAEAKKELAVKVKGVSNSMLLPTGAKPPLDINREAMDKFR